LPFNLRPTTRECMDLFSYTPSFLLLCAFKTFWY